MSLIELNSREKIIINERVNQSPLQDNLRLKMQLVNKFINIYFMIILNYYVNEQEVQLMDLNFVIYSILICNFSFLIKLINQLVGIYSSFKGVFLKLLLVFDIVYFNFSIRNFNYDPNDQEELDLLSINCIFKSKKVQKYYQIFILLVVSCLSSSVNIIDSNRRYSSLICNFQF